MAKSKGGKSSKTKRGGGAKAANRPAPAKLSTPTPSEPLALTKHIPEVREQVKKVTIDRHKREVLHELWPEILLGNVSHAESAIWRSIGTYKAGLTPQEVEVLKDVRQNLRAELDRLNVIYFRLKFWS